MKKIIILLIICSFIFAAQYEDVIYLKDGSVVYGTIIEQKPGEYYKIQSGKNIFVFAVDEIDIIKKEEITVEKTTNTESNILLDPRGFYYLDPVYE